MQRTIIGVAAAIMLAACGDKAAEPAAKPAAPVVPGAWAIDKAASKIEFSGTQTGKAFTGRFESFDAVIILDSDNLPAARIEAVIDTGSAKTGDRQRDAALPGAEWFSATAFPQARFVSQSVTAAAGGAYEARGKLTIRDAEKDLLLPFTLDITGDRAVADAEVTLNRADFGVGQGEDFLTDKWVGYEVKVSLHLEATR
ncbi:MAG: YceI family protein [Parvularculaceae bacterium]|nr:YceI family protein [Parvularculaceae bacterium]